jgi:hypothetical protein
MNPKAAISCLFFKRNNCVILWAKEFFVIAGYPFGTPTMTKHYYDLDSDTFIALLYNAHSTLKCNTCNFTNDAVKSLYRRLKVGYFS